MILTVSDLIREIELRKKREKETRERINEYCRKVYGIDDFFGKVHKIFKGMNDYFVICLARQIPTINIEHLGKKCLEQWLSVSGLKTVSLALALTSDSFRGENSTKLSYVNIRYLRKSRNGSIYVKHEKIVAKEIRGVLNNCTLHKIQTIFGKNLVDYHYELRKKVLGDGSREIDFSAFYLECVKECLKNSGKKPSILFVEDGLREKAISSDFLNEGNITRPPAEWYYPLYLMLFTDGNKALISTVGDDEKVSSWFADSIKMISEIAGVPPLIIDTPNKVITPRHSSDLSEIPDWVLNDSQWMEKIRIPPPESNIFEAYEFFEKRFIELL